MILAIILLVLGILVTYLLLMPIVLSIDTEKNEYFIQFKGLAKAHFESHEEELIRIKLNIFFMNFYFFPIEEYHKRKQKKINQKKQKPKKTKGLKFNKYNVWLLIKSFQIKHFEMHLDTGNVITNAKLYPAFSLLNYYQGGFNINFVGYNKLFVRLQNRPIDILKIFINH